MSRVRLLENYSGMENVDHFVRLRSTTDSQLTISKNYIPLLYETLKVTNKYSVALNKN